MKPERLQSHAEGISEDDLEALIARFTLEYLYRWTNNFEPQALAEFKRMLDKAGPPAELVRMLRSSGGATAKYPA
jgi:hypothetical protein